MFYVNIFSAEGPKTEDFVPNRGINKAIKAFFDIKSKKELHIGLQMAVIAVTTITTHFQCNPISYNRVISHFFRPALPQYMQLRDILTEFGEIQ